MYFWAMQYLSKASKIMHPWLFTEFYLCCHLKAENVSFALVKSKFENFCQLVYISVFSGKKKVTFPCHHLPCPAESLLPSPMMQTMEISSWIATDLGPAASKYGGLAGAIN